MRPRWPWPYGITLEAPHDPSASLLPREVMAGAVIAREHDGPHVKLTWLSRDCPTHKDEADRLVKGAP